MRKYVFFIYVFIAIAGITGTVFAQTTERFADLDVYEQSGLNGQDGWSNVWNSPKIQSEVASDGGKAIQNEKSFGTATYKSLAEELLGVGVVSAEIRIDDNNLSDNQEIFGIFKGIGEESIAVVRFANKFNGYNNTLLVSVAGSTDTKEVGHITQGEWHKVSLGWRDSDFSIRIKIDDGEWSEWFSSQTSWKQGESFGVRVTLPAAKDYGDFYVDELETFVGTEDISVIPEEIPEIQSIISPLDTTSTTTITATIDGDLPETATSTDEEVITAPLDDGNVSTTTTAEF